MISESSGDIGETHVTLFGGIKGLITQGEALGDSLERVRPDAIFISISPEHVSGLSNFMKDPYEIILSDYEIIYGVHLSVYGEVMTPPPIYTEAVKYGEANGVDVIGLDMDEAQFSQLYSKKMGTFALVRHSVRKRRLLKADFRDKTPEEFVLAWDKRVNRIKALREIDQERLVAMENRLMEYISREEFSNAFVIVDYEFYRPFREFLKAQTEKTDRNETP